MSSTSEPKNDDSASQRVDRVHKWRDDIAVEQNTAEVVARLHTTSRELYKAFLLELRDKNRQSKSQYRQLESGYTNYLIWADDYGVLDGSLDAKLQTSQRLLKFTTKLLINICTMLWKVCWTYEFVRSDAHLQNLYQVASITAEESSHIVHGINDYSDSESDISDDGEELDAHEESLQVASETLLDEIGNLLDLGPRLEEPVPDYCTKKQPPIPKPSPPWNAVQYFADTVSTKFPKCDGTLANALGRSNWDSMIRLLTSREAISNVKSGEHIGVKMPISADKQATGFKDSGLGTSMPSTNLYAATVVSYRRDGDTRARIPPQPKNIKGGQLFQCIACGENIKKGSTKAWKQHLLADLKPWVCCDISCPCERRPFDSREEWVEHLRRNHEIHPEWDDKTCPICSEVVVGGGYAMISHVALHLEEISLTVLPCDPDNDDVDENLANLDLNKTKSFHRTWQEDASPSLFGGGGSGGGGGRSLVLENGERINIWYCCQCSEGPMVVLNTPVCVFCNSHIRCPNC
ncbi:uncharacterized protein F4807DRAFT_413088 [Annulohypoxylon truncatum]|uniref:uncharacterized protein n=1 Tax=Annulohypoxylon truncatum TaxID=327061 RepID=UPI0020082578|nr:uncharacterized protein F4807DRAFT_413088 [Annulohypoxylon truncatum]KAI1213158.1 hypothetical protein F4807DRAFT_413088 [Annulohypoxylon truncatum]